jgi:hypothetical protein
LELKGTALADLRHVSPDAIVPAGGAGYFFGSAVGGRDFAVRAVTSPHARSARLIPFCVCC